MKALTNDLSAQVAPGPFVVHRNGWGNGADRSWSHVYDGRSDGHCFGDADGFGDGDGDNGYGWGNGWGDVILNRRNRRRLP